MGAARDRGVRRKRSVRAAHEALVQGRRQVARGVPREPNGEATAERGYQGGTGETVRDAGGEHGVQVPHLAAVEFVRVAIIHD